MTRLNQRINVEELRFISTTQLCAKLGFPVSVGFLMDAGAKPVSVSRQGTYWDPSKMKEIREKLASYILKGIDYD